MKRSLLPLLAFMILVVFLGIGLGCSYHDFLIPHAIAQ